MIPLLIGWAVVLAALYTIMITRKSSFTHQSEVQVNSLQLSRYNNLFFSKSSQLANAMQSFITDNQIQKNLVKDLSDGVLHQSPSDQPTEREGVYLIEWDVYATYTYPNSSIFYKADNGLIYTNPHYARVASYYDNLTYNELIPSHQQSLYIGSAADVFTHAVSYNNLDFYFYMYQGYDTGLTYFSAGTWISSYFQNVTDNLHYNTQGCNVTGNPFVVGYDCRCRPWYINQSKPNNQPYAIFSNVEDLTGSFNFQTLTDYSQFNNGSSAVVAIELNMKNPFYDGVMLSYMEDKSIPYFMSMTLDNDLILKSSDVDYTEIKDTAYFMASDEALRFQFREEIYPYVKKNYNSVLQLPYQDLDSDGKIVNRTLISSPIALVLQDPLYGGNGSLNGTMYLGVGIQTQTISIAFLDKQGIIVLVMVFVILVLFVFGSNCMIQWSIRQSLTPLVSLNIRMYEMVENRGGGDDFLGDDDMSEEIEKLYDSIRKLLSNRRILNNEFLNKPDALAVIEIAEACTLFDGKSYAAAAVCHNNIGNIQYKNERFNLAADNFLSAYILSEISLGGNIGQNMIVPRDFYQDEKKQEVLAKVPAIESPDQMQYFFTVRANRYYQFTMSLYKGLRYKGESHFQTFEKEQQKETLDIENTKKKRVSDLRETLRRFSQIQTISSKWQEVDLHLRNSVDLFKNIVVTVDGLAVPIFLDMIIKITICRCFAMLQNRSIITAEKLLKLAEKMILILQEPNYDIALRNGAPVIPRDILQQKLFLHKGKLMTSFGKESLAKDLFLQSINTGKIYDIRVRLEAIKQLLSNHKGKKDLHYSKLERLLRAYNHKQRDFVFLVNQSCHLSRNMTSYMEDVSNALTSLLDNRDGQIENRDRISLIKFAQNQNRVFSLVEKEQNFQQLKNQLKPDKLQATKNVPAQLGKAINCSANEFSPQSPHKRWLVVFTNQIAEEQKSRVSLLQSAEIIRKKQINLVLICYGLSKQEEELARRFTDEVTHVSDSGASNDLDLGCEAHLLVNPNAHRIDQLFTNLSNYQINYQQPMIIETFKST